MPPKSSQPRLYFLPAMGEERALSPTDSDVLSTLRSSHFDGTDDLIIRPQSIPLARSIRGRNASSKKKQRTSWVYDHIKGDDREAEYYDKKERLIWICRHCNEEYLLSGGTTGISKHLIGKHEQERSSTRDTQVKNQQRSIADALTEAGRRPQKRRKLYDRQSGESLDGTVLEILWVNVLVACSLALRLICLRPFRAFL